MKELIEIGNIVNTHGIKGEVKVQAWCDDPSLLLELDSFYIDEKTVLKVGSSRMHKESILIQFEGINDINKAENLKNTVLYAEKDIFELDDTTFFVKDLIGLTVFDVDSAVKYGTLTDVFQTGANDVYVIKNENKEYLVPAIKECIIETNIKDKTMKIRPLKGLFD